MRRALNMPLVRFDQLLPLKFRVLAAVLSLSVTGFIEKSIT